MTNDLWELMEEHSFVMAGLGALILAQIAQVDLREKVLVPARAVCTAVQGCNT